MREAREMAREAVEAPTRQAVSTPPAYEFLRFMEEVPASTYYAGFIGSILLSMGLFLVGRRSLALFVGLWPPTILATTLFFKLLRPTHEGR